MPEQDLVIDSGSTGTRLDLFLSRHLMDMTVVGGISRAEIQRLIRSGEITLNGRRAKASARLRLHDLVRIQNLPPRESPLRPEAVPLEVVFEDCDFLVVNKPPGMVVHPAAGRTSGTLVNALLHHCPNIDGIGGERRPGIVHRLDKDTSGVMIVAKNSTAFRRLAAQFKSRGVDKHYLALAWGRMPAMAGVVDRPIGRHRSDRKKMSSLYTTSRRRDAITEWRVNRVFQCADEDGKARWTSWLQLKPQTGRTHQLRVHLAELGHPLVGDKTYGKRARHDGGQARPIDALASFPRQVLHASSLALDHPRTGVRVKFRAPLAKDIEILLNTLVCGADC